MDVLAGGGGLDALHHGAAEFGISLRGKADPQRARRDRTEAIAIDSGACALQESAMDERPEQAEDGGLGELRSVDHVGEAQVLAEAAKRLQDLGRAERFATRCGLRGAWERQRRRS